MSTEIEVEEEVETPAFEEETSYVVWESSEFAPPTKKFPSTIEVIENEIGQKQLDPAEITWTTPKENFWRGYPRPTAESGKLDKPISITISRSDIINPLVANNIGLKIDAKTPEGIFSQVVKAVSDLWNTPKADGQPLSVREMSAQSGINVKTWQNYLHVADFAGLFMKHQRGKRIRAPSKKTIKEIEFVEDFEDWKKERPPNTPEEEAPVQVWINARETAQAKQPQQELWKAMKIMQVTPTMLMALASEQEKAKAIKKLEDLVQTERMPDPRNSKNIFPVKKMIKNKKGQLVLPNDTLTPKGKNPRVWFQGYWDKYHQGKNDEGVALFNPQMKPDHFENKRWSLEEWSNHFDAPDPFGHEKDKGKYKGVWFGKPRQLTLKAVKRGDNNVFYNFIGLIRQFMDVHGMGLGDLPEESPLSQVANPPRSATIHLKVDQIEAMNECLMEGIKGNIPEFTDWNTYRVEGDKITFKDIEEAKSYWHDAYFFFKLSLELGFRAEEAFTLVATKLDSQTVGGAKEGNSGVFEAPNGDMTVNIYTRKGDKGKKGQKIHGGYIISEETKDLIRKRLKEVEEGMDAKSPEIALEKYGVTQQLDGREYRQHSLIGADGRYTELGTLDKPATAYGKKREEGLVKPTGKRNKIRAMMRHCYHQAKLTDDYWYEHSLHSLRHVFAQYWLELSEFNYGFVAIIGHWKTESIVRDVYGQKTGGEIVYQMKKFALGEKFDQTPMERLKENQIAKEKAPSATGIEAKITQQFYGASEEELYLEDKKLREKIFFEGGEYYDVRLPEDQREKRTYPKGTDIQVTKTKTEIKSLFKKETKEDATTQTGLEEGK